MDKLTISYNPDGSVNEVKYKVNSDTEKLITRIEFDDETLTPAQRRITSELESNLMYLQMLIGDVLASI